jgi:hypothetical protein
VQSFILIGPEVSVLWVSKVYVSPYESEVVVSTVLIYVRCIPRSLEAR